MMSPLKGFRFKAMIRIKLDDNSLKRQITGVIKSMNSTTSSPNINSVAKAVSSIAAQEFIKSLNRQARVSKSEFHHLYEWGEVGKDSARLVVARRKVSGGNAMVDLVFKKSVKKVPIAAALTKPGKTGKSVVRTSVFKNKAEFMESGSPAHWTAKRNVVFMNGKKIMFKHAGTNFVIKNPGGRQTTKSLEKYSKKWESGMANAAIEKSRIFNKIEKDVAKTLSMPKPSVAEIRRCIKIVCESYEVRGDI